MSLPKGITVIKSKNPGPKVGIMALCHGDEVAGLTVIDYLSKHITPELLLRGELYLVKGNLKASEMNKRCVEENMNRLFMADDDPRFTHSSRKSYDYERSRELMPVLAELDFFLDLHSASKKAVPFSLTYSNKVWMQGKIAKMFPVEYFVNSLVGYADGIANEWVEKHGGISIALESGQHLAPEGVQISLDTAKIFLQEAGIAQFHVTASKVPHEIEVYDQQKIEHPSTFRYQNDYISFQKLVKGELIAQCSHRDYHAHDEYDGQMIILPVSEESLRNGGNTDAYFLGRLVKS